MILILLELNEINFDAVNLYIQKGKSLPGFNKLINQGLVSTKAELEYKNLEPWIQLPSVHTGKTFEEHQVFRLGDFVNSTHSQFFEKVEKAGFSVGAISPMNASNKLKDPAYFIPDPWTKTPSDSSTLSRRISDAIEQAVNDNSQSKLTLKTLFNLGLAFILLVRPSRYAPMLKYALKSIGKSWKKALFLDMLLFEFHKTLLKRTNPNFSTLFLNAGAHIQHHYFFNSLYVTDRKLRNPSWYVSEECDPFLDMLEVYDEILSSLLDLSNTEIIIATGLSQKPYDRLKFYYRLKNHSAFLDKIGIQFTKVIPRMTRDFLISFDSVEEASLAEEQLSKIFVNKDIRLFEEIDNRGKDIFVVLTFSEEITNETYITYLENNMPLIDLVSFVAIKNGEHQSKGFAYFSNGLRNFVPDKFEHISEINKVVLDYFGA